ncbi:peptide ABC transporter permease [Burkholderia ubonensis]|uniref:Peptide ABC transporter permease n=2 Tax=Burkholderia cepacia complex TaxID=87882 RepID=A0A1B4Q4B8_BURCE|nr:MULTISPECIES: ABC transporter permease [Burkholderia cepacia complex]AOK21020.1 peptide ABC transporter permease [Burkholderia cepacia]AOK27788.1 peptide ABC transporter permease [Burkholderia ubonensis]KVO32381.1 peptide ABC transporter permease [Burkholderia ubonensis]KVU56471.1 peptide ABC transporter permease [Burkholderia ubonensis]KVV42756.1 peptide ABC transporter permease [Burkholderia ubonensis]
MSTPIAFFDRIRLLSVDHAWARWTLRLVRWLVTLFITFLGLLAVTFIISRKIPIDPVLAVLGDRASAQAYAAERIALGLDRPLVVQFSMYAHDVLRGDLGISLLTSNPVLTDIKRVFPATVELATIATLIGVLTGVPLGVIAAVRHNRWIDHVARFIGLIGNSVPVFWLGLMGLLLFYAKLHWVSGSGRLDPVYDGMVDAKTGSLLIDSVLAGEWEVFFNALSHIILPAMILGYYSVAYLSRMTRSFVLDQLNQEYITTARAKGLPERRVIWRHAFGNIAVPLLTVIALSYSYLLEGSVLTEIVFAWPGIGSYLTNALLSADMNAVLGSTLVIGATFIGLNLLTDALYRVFDPRARQRA